MNKYYLNTTSVIMVWSNDWDDFVTEVYGKPYCFQQQDGCRSRGTIPLNVTGKEYTSHFPDTIPYEINGDKMGVSFKTWLNTSPAFYTEIFWKRNFYPDVQEIANDLFLKDLLDQGEYVINIDW